MKARLLFSMFSLLMCFGLSAQSIGIIGSSTPGGWDNDTDMVQDSANPDLWSLSITLFDGEAKFRLDDEWTTNWGSADFPTGVGEQDGANIPVVAGDYNIGFNSATGEYFFVVSSDIGIIGSATSAGWDSDINMFIDQTDPNKYFITLDLMEGEAKFRQFDDWAVNWGSADFPMGIGEQDGINIPVSPAGEYRVDFDKSTGEYSFEQIITINSVVIMGSAGMADMTQSPADPNVWTFSGSFAAGGAMFQANEDVSLTWGGTDFPTGTAVAGGGEIPVTAGDWLVTFNTETGDYSFQQIVEYTTVGIIGDATPGGWAEDTDLEKDPMNGAMWTLRIILSDGEAKFRAEDAWNVDWGSGDFPVGTGVQGGANIPITAGEYEITFNSITGDYTFEEIVVFTTVGLIGPATPIGDWDTDVDMVNDANDEHLWVLDEVNLIDGEAKFRAEDDWAVNWGLDVWPSGVGEQDGPNIPITGGTWYVTINTLTGDYLFIDPALKTQEALDPSIINIFPNPTNSKITVDMEGLEFNGNVDLKVIDMMGRVHKFITVDAKSLPSIDVSDLSSGNYLLQISNPDLMIGKRFSVE